MSRPASSSGVYGFTVAIVGTFDRIKNVGMISNSDATATATTVITVNFTGKRSHFLCHQSVLNVARPLPQFEIGTPRSSSGRVASPSYSLLSRGARLTTSSYTAGRLRQVL